MEKLEKLLKEYAPNYCNDLPNGIIMDELVISKKFGFIKWLVENDKIDTDKMEEKSEYTFLKKRGGEHIIEDVIMLLSISDTPIEDLISYLR